MNQHCPHCKRRIPIIKQNYSKTLKRPQNITQTLKNISLYDLVEEFSKKRNDQHFNLIEFLTEKIQKQQDNQEHKPLPERKKWDIPHK